MRSCLQPRTIPAAQHRTFSEPRRPRVSARGAAEPPPSLWLQAERLLTSAAASASAGGGGRWEEVEGAWVLLPLAPARGVIHFVGGAFAGAAPQLTYRLLLETLCDRGELAIIATPYSLSFDHLRITDTAQFGFDRARRTLGARLPPDLPVWGVGHSLGALIQTLISARYGAQRAGTVLMSAWRSGALSFYLTHIAQASTTSLPAMPSPSFCHCSRPPCRA